MDALPPQVATTADASPPEAPTANTPEPELLADSADGPRTAEEYVLVMKGGGAKGLAYLGALQVLQDYYRFNWYVGTSAGAIAAVLLAAGYTPRELEEKLRQKSFSDFMDASWYQWPTNFVFRSGIFPAQELNNWLEGLLNEKLTPDSGTAVRLEHLKHRCTVYAARRGTEALEFDSQDPETKRKEAALAVRASVSIPYVFQPQSHGEQRVFDGGIRHNYPLLTFLSRHNEGNRLKFLGLYLGSPVYRHEQPGRLVIFDLLKFWLSSADEEALKRHSDRTIVIDPAPVSTLKFDLSEDEKDFLIAVGGAAALAYVARQTDLERRPSAQEVKDARQKAEALRQKVILANKKRRRRRVVSLLLVVLAVTVGAAWKYGVISRAHCKIEAAMSTGVSEPESIRSLAVLPFVNNSSVKEHVLEGVMVDLTSSMMGVLMLEVRPAPSVMNEYKMEPSCIRHVAQSLKVEAVLLANVSQLGDRLSVDVELIDAATERVLKTFPYIYEEDKLSSLKGNITRDVTLFLQKNMQPAQREREGRPPTENSEAYRLYTLGDHLWRARSITNNFDEAISAFEKAHLLDPRFPQPLVGLANCIAQLEDYRGDSPRETLPRAKAYAELALERDPNMAEAHAALGYVQFGMREWDAAKASLERAIALKKNAQFHHWYSMLMRTMGHKEKAYSELEIANTLDPSSPRIFTNIGMYYYWLGDTDKAILNLNLANKHNPSSGFADCYLAMAYLKEGKSAEAVEAAVRGDTLLKSTHMARGFLGYVYAQTGDRPKALEIVEQLKVMYNAKPKPQASAVTVAIVYAGLGMKDEAFKWMNYGLDDGGLALPIFIGMPQFESLRGDPRYEELFRRMNYPEWAILPK